MEDDYTKAVGMAYASLQVGMQLEVTFKEVGEGVSLPNFRPAE
jgi:hypothetical protein